MEFFTIPGLPARNLRLRVSVMTAVTDPSGNAVFVLRRFRALFLIFVSVGAFCPLVAEAQIVDENFGIALQVRETVQSGVVQITWMATCTFILRPLIILTIFLASADSIPSRTVIPWVAVFA